MSVISLLNGDSEYGKKRPPLLGVLWAVFRSCICEYPWYKVREFVPIF